MVNIKYKEFEGEFVKECPCSPEAVSCGYYNLNLHTGCPYSCTYCILQAYLDSKEPVFYTNIEIAIKHLEKIAKSEKYVRIGTGELSDSLAFDRETDTTETLLKIFRKFPEIIFEFKTKSVNIEKLLKVKPEKNIIISWSLNPQMIIEREEIAAPSLKERLAAIKKVINYGYKIGIHFDPLILTSGWRELYRELIEDISKTVNKKRIAWWSLGSLRFPESLKTHIMKHSGSRLFDGELIKTQDGKYRYFKPLKIELYKFIRDEIRLKVGKDTPLYLCMEDREVWEEIFPELEPDRESINRYLYKNTFK